MIKSLGPSEVACHGMPTLGLRSDEMGKQDGLKWSALWHLNP